MRRSMRTRVSFATSAVAALAVLAAGCSGGTLGSSDGGDEDGPVKIGMLLPTSGVFAPIAEDMKAGFQLYLDEHDGKMGGREVELIIEDDEATPDVGLRKANKLIEQDRVDFGTGIVSSAVALQVVGAFEEAEVPLIVSNSIANAITGAERSDFVFRTSQSSHQLSFPVGKWIADEFDKAPLFLSSFDAASGHELIEGVRDGYERAGGKVVGESFAPFGETQDYQPYLSKVRGSGATVNYAYFAGGEALNYVKQYDQFGLKGDIDLIGPGSLTTSDVLTAQGTSAEGVNTVLPYAWTLDSPANKEFVKAYKAKTNRNPSYFAVFSYDSAQLIAQAIEASDGDLSDGAAVAKSMEGAKIDSPRGPLTIDATTHGTVQKMYVARVEKVDGELIPVIVADLGAAGEQPE